MLGVREKRELEARLDLAIERLPLVGKLYRVREGRGSPWIWGVTGEGSLESLVLHSGDVVMVTWLEDQEGIAQKTALATDIHLSETRTLGWIASHMAFDIHILYNERFWTGSRFILSGWEQCFELIETSL